MLQAIHIKNFKSYQDATLDLSPLTVMIGANASGKSNALEAIRFLSWLAQGQRLSSLQYLVNENDRVVRGNIETLARMGLQKFSLGCTLSGEDFNRLNVLLELREKELHIADEQLYNAVNNSWLYQVKYPSKGKQNNLEVEYNNFARGGKKPLITVTDQMSVFTQMSSAARFVSGHKKAQNVIPEVTAKYESALQSILFLDPVPQKMRDSSYEGDKKLHENGSNLSSILYNLIEEDATNEQRILDFVQSLPEQNLIGIEFLKGFKKEVLIQVKENFAGKEQLMDAGLLSDGTLRVLAYAAALLSAPEGSMVIVEELDNGVHPSRASHLLDIIHSTARRRNLSVLITSHNPALLDALPNEIIPKTVFCYRDPETGFSKLIKLEDLERYPELVAQGSIGSLLTRGLVDKYAKTKSDSEERVNQGLEWLKSIK